MQKNPQKTKCDEALHSWIKTPLLREERLILEERLQVFFQEDVQLFST